MAQLTGSAGVMSALFGGGIGGLAGGLLGWLLWKPLCGVPSRQADLGHLFERDCPVIGAAGVEQWVLFSAAVGGFLLFVVQAFRWASR